MREADHVIVLDRQDVRDHVALVSDLAAEGAPDVGDGVRDSGSAVVTERLAEGSPGVEGAPDAAQAEESLRAVCDSVLGDPRFVGQAPVTPDGARLTHRADRMLVAKLAELTATFPVDAGLLARARSMCLDLWTRRGDRR